MTWDTFMLKPIIDLGLVLDLVLVNGENEKFV